MNKVELYDFDTAWVILSVALPDFITKAPAGTRYILDISEDTWMKIINKCFYDRTLTENVCQVSLLGDIMLFSIPIITIKNITEVRND